MNDEEIFKRALASAKANRKAQDALGDMMTRRWGNNAQDVYSEYDELADPLGHGEGSISWAKFQKIMDKFTKKGC